MKYQSLALYCGSSAGNNPLYAREAARFGKMCAQKSLTLYFGGGSIGLMGAAAEACLSKGGKVIGVAPDFFTQGEVTQPETPNSPSQQYVLTEAGKAME